MITKAQNENAETMSFIADAVSLENMPSDKNGFLTHNPGYSYYEEMINKSDYCYVAVEQGRSVGFLLAYSSDMFDPNDDIQRYFMDNYPGQNFIYIFQVAICPEHQKKGLGRMLYEKLFKDTPGIIKRTIISAEPYNKASEIFHQKIGFKKAGTMYRSDGGSSFIYEYTK